MTCRHFRSSAVPLPLAATVPVTLPPSQVHARAAPSRASVPASLAEAALSVATVALALLAVVRLAPVAA